MMIDRFAYSPRVLLKWGLALFSLVSPLIVLADFFPNSDVLLRYYLIILVPAAPGFGFFTYCRLSQPNRFELSGAALVVRWPWRSAVAPISALTVYPFHRQTLLELTFMPKGVNCAAWPSGTVRLFPDLAHRSHLLRALEERGATFRSDASGLVA